MRTNVAMKNSPNAPRTHEGALATQNPSALAQLKRSVMACMLWEDSFYEDGKAIADRIAELLKQVSFSDAAQVAIDAREKMKLRHAPLQLAVSLIRAGNQGRSVGDLIEHIIQRPDELGELCALYWKDQPGKPITKQMKVGLGRALGKFSEYQLAKWNKEGAVKLRDVLFLAHAKPKGAAERYTKVERRAKSERVLSDAEALYARIAADTMATPDTWEVELSGGADKKAVFERLIRERKLGALAFLRNLRGMIEAKCDEDLMRDYLLTVNLGRILPFRFIAAAKYAPRLEDAIEAAMLRCIAEQAKLPGKTALLVDHSGSMQQLVSSKSEITRFDAAGAVATLLREVSDRCRVFTFSDRMIEVPPRRGFAMLQEVRRVINPVSTMLGAAVRAVYQTFPECERIIVITDEQSADRPPHPQGTGYIVNVGTDRNGIGYGPWVSINGWSEAILDYIREFEDAGK